MIKRVTKTITGLDKVIDEAFGWANAYYGSNTNYKNHFKLYRKPVAEVPVYEVTQDFVTKTASDVEHYYHALCLTALHLIMGDSDQLRRVYHTTVEGFEDRHLGVIANVAKNELRKSGIFLRSDINKYSTACILRTQLTGRFDCAVNNEGIVNGVYEFNGDTPVMLFESTYIQDHIARFLDKDQFNEIFPMVAEESNVFAGENAGVIFDPQYPDDLSTGLTTATILEGIGYNVYMGNIEDLNYDVLGGDFPFSVGQFSQQISLIYMLLSWEDMARNDNMNALMHSSSWSKNVEFVSAAWRWFMSHKGILAFITECLEDRCEDEELSEIVRSAFKGIEHLHIPTYWQTDNPLTNYVMKPVLGRQSSDIKIVLGDKIIESDTKYFSEDVMICQEYRPCPKIDGVRYMPCIWVYGETSAGLSFRETTDETNEDEREEFVAHVIV